MEKRIHELYRPEVLAEAARRFGALPEQVHEVGGFELFVYAYTLDGQERILRISHSLHRSAAMTHGEVDFINYLADNGVPAARALPSTRGELVEALPVEEGHFSAVSFAKAAGQPPALADWQNGLSRRLGILAGRMHRLARDYQPADPAWRRPGWREELHGFAEAFLPVEQTAVIARWNAVLAEMERLPQDADQVGLVHQDLHGGNFFVQDGQITLFDFDDCQYIWYAYDVAMAYFYVLPYHYEHAGQLDDARSFLREFIDGYSQENRFDPQWLDWMPLFLKQREIALYTAIHRSEDLDHMDSYTASFMRGRRAAIEADQPFFPDVTAEMRRELFG